VYFSKSCTAAASMFPRWLWVYPTFLPRLDFCNKMSFPALRCVGISGNYSRTLHVSCFFLRLLSPQSSANLKVASLLNYGQRFSSPPPPPPYFTDFSAISKSFVSNTWFVVAGKSPYLEILGWTVHMFLFFGLLKRYASYGHARRFLLHLPSSSILTLPASSRKTLNVTAMFCSR
jgi:hypothetical protein